MRYTGAGMHVRSRGLDEEEGYIGAKAGPSDHTREATGLQRFLMSLEQSLLFFVRTIRADSPRVSPFVVATPETL
jgi:hypothetical protein